MSSAIAPVSTPELLALLVTGSIQGPAKDGGSALTADLDSAVIGSAREELPASRVQPSPGPCDRGLAGCGTAGTAGISAGLTT